MTISGRGSMENYYSYNSYQPPWYSYRESITSLIIGESVTTIGDEAFRDCFNLTSVTIGGCVTSICHAAFSGCTNLSDMTIPDSVTTIGDYSFYDCDNLTSVTIPYGVTTIGEHAFTSCGSMTGFYVDKNNHYYSNDAQGVLFDKNKTRLIEAPGGITGFYDIPDGVTIIGYWAFSDCGSLTSVTIPDSVTTIGNGVFRFCDSLTGFYVDEKNRIIPMMPGVCCLIRIKRN